MGRGPEVNGRRSPAGPSPLPSPPGTGERESGRQRTCPPSQSLNINRTFQLQAVHHRGIILQPDGAGAGSARGRWRRWGGSLTSEEDDPCRRVSRDVAAPNEANSRSRRIWRGETKPPGGVRRNGGSRTSTGPEVANEATASVAPMLRPPNKPISPVVARGANEANSRRKQRRPKELCYRYVRFKGPPVPFPLCGTNPRRCDEPTAEHQAVVANEATVTLGHV
jgi:hypothetical protein